MVINGLTVADFEAIVQQVSERWYAGNVVPEWRKRYGDHGTPSMLNTKGTRFRGRIVVRDSSGSGARRSWTGRRMPAACWHVFRDVVRQTLHDYPAVTFTTSMARYDAATFEATYPATGTRNVGSQYAPVTMPELCNCASDPRVDEGITPAAVSMATWGTETAWMHRLDAVAHVEAGRCAWCSGPTLGAESMWCSPEHYEMWQEKYAVQ